MYIVSKLWTLQRPFSCIRHGYQLICMLKKLKDGDVAEVHRPAPVPGFVWAALQDCLMIDPQARPVATTLLKRFEGLQEMDP